MDFELKGILEPSYLKFLTLSNWVLNPGSNSSNETFHLQRGALFGVFARFTGVTIDHLPEIHFFDSFRTLSLDLKIIDEFLWGAQQNLPMMGCSKRDAEAKAYSYYFYFERPMHFERLGIRVYNKDSSNTLNLQYIWVLWRDEK